VATARSWRRLDAASATSASEVTILRFVFMISPSEPSLKRDGSVHAATFITEGF
jgi:hypothetical protein